MIPKKGTWIMIKGLVIPVKLPVPPLSIWYAKPTGKLMVDDDHVSRLESFRYDGSMIGFRDFDHVTGLMFEYQKSPDNIKHLNAGMHGAVVELCKQYTITQQVSIVTPWGEVNIQPHEYTVIKNNVDSYIDQTRSEHATLHLMSGHSGMKKKSMEKLNEQVFYLQSRGIGYVEALRMCVQSVKSQYLFWIEMHEEYQKMFTRHYDQHVAKKKRYGLNQAAEIL